MSTPIFQALGDVIRQQIILGELKAEIDRAAGKAAATIRISESTTEEQLAQLQLTPFANKRWEDLPMLPADIVWRPSTGSGYEHLKVSGENNQILVDSIVIGSHNNNDIFSGNFMESITVDSNGIVVVYPNLFYRETGPDAR